MSELFAILFFALLGVTCLAVTYKSVREFVDHPDDPIVFFCLLPIGLFMLIFGGAAMLAAGATLWELVS